MDGLDWEGFCFCFGWAISMTGVDEVERGLISLLENESRYGYG